MRRPRQQRRADSAAPTQMDTPFGRFALQRRPPAGKAPLQAWDAADRALLDIAGQARDRLDTPPLLVNDAFGALAVPLADTGALIWSDSRVSQLAIAANLAHNQRPLLDFVPGHASPLLPRGGLVLWRLPRNRAWLLEQLAVLRRVALAGGAVYAAAMSKHAATDTHELLQRYWGPVERLRAPNHALLFGLGTPAAEAAEVPGQARNVSGPDGTTLLNLPNAFSRGRLDEGAALMLAQLPQLPRALDIADLGCGDGVLGLAAQRLQPAARIWFIDESCQALCSAAFNADAAAVSAQAGLASSTLPHSSPSPAPRFALADAFEDDTPPAAQRFDVILCNPPFHQQHVVGDQIAWRMLKGSLQRLRPGGELWLVGNRHLAYHLKLQRLFGNCRTVAANPKFVVLVAGR